MSHVKINNFRMKIVLAFVLILSVKALAVDSKSIPAPQPGMRKTQLKDLFDKVNQQYRSDLGPQCLGDKEYKKLAATYNVKNIIGNDWDYPTFLENVKDQGLLDEEFFKDPKKPGVSFKGAIDSIVEGTRLYQVHNMIDNPKVCGLNQKEIFALLYYTGEGYRMLNNANREEDIAKLEKTRIIGQQMNLGMLKMKPFVGWVKRGQSFSDPEKLKKFIAEYAEGNTVTLKGYTSTSIGAGFNGQIRMAAYVKNDCRYVADFSLVETKVFNGVSQMEEEEVLCMPNTQFKVLMHEVDGYGNHEIVLEEI